MKVVYVNHTGALGGGERSLMDLLRGLPATVSPTVACPEGELASAVHEAGVQLVVIPEVDLSFRFDRLTTPAGLARAGRSAFALGRVVARLRPDIVHANSLRAALLAAPVARLGGPPIVAHVRDCLPAGSVANFTRRVVSSSAAFVVANSEHTAQGFASPRGRAALRVVYNGVDLEQFDPDCIGRDAARARLGFDGDTPLLGVLAQITPWKAQDDAIRTLAAVRVERPSARLLVVGSPKFIGGAVRYDNETFWRSLRTLVDELGLDGSVRFLGERTDVPELLRALDVVLVPSWEEPFGRVVTEAMAMEVPVIATRNGGPGEIVSDGYDGVLLPPRRPDLWAGETLRLLDSPGLRAAMGRRGRRTVTERFSREAHVREVLAVYRAALEGKRA